MTQEEKDQFEKLFTLIYNLSPCIGRDGKPYMTMAIMGFGFGFLITFLMILMCCANKKCRTGFCKCISRIKTKNNVEKN